MSVIFLSQNHEYKSVDPTENIHWLSVTSLVGLFKQEFDAVTQSVKSSKNKRSKWFGMSPEEIQKVWAQESLRSTDLGTFYHNQREADFMGIDTIQREGLDLPIIKPMMDGEKKLAPSQNLTPGVYPEHFVFLKSAGICGQSDRVEVIGPYVDIIDYKTNKEIKTQSWKNFEGMSQKMTGPVMHLDDCNFNHYALQLSIYMYIIQKHNHNLTPRNLMLQHVVFEEEGQDKFGYPITKKDSQNNPIVKAVIPYKVPYLKKEVQDIIKWLAENRSNIKKKQPTKTN